MFDRNPVTIVEAIKQLIVQGLNTLLLFKVFEWTTEQTAAVNILVGLFVAFAGALFVRSKVFAPTSKDGAPLEAVKYEGQPIENVK